MAKQQPGNRKQHLEKEEINWKLEHQGSMRFRRNIYTCETQPTQHKKAKVNILPNGL